jgi:hypothetical protein
MICNLLCTLPRHSLAFGARKLCRGALAGAVVTVTMTSALAARPPLAPARIVRSRVSEARTLSRTIDHQELTPQQRGHAQMLEAQVKSWADTPAWALVPTQGHVQFHPVQYPDVVNYTNGKVAIMRVSGLGKSNVLDLVGLMPVSGHVGSTREEKLARAAEYARTNKYRIEVEHPDGQVEHIQPIDSTGFVTPHELQIHLQTGKTIVRFTPTATMVEGYLNGRTIELHWNGQE